MRELNRRGANVRESGAFLLGRRTQEGTGEIVEFAYYDDLDPHCLNSGIVEFSGLAYGKLWNVCEKSGLSVVADVHTHPGAPWQSELDRTHPMICQRGHFALIVPRFADRVYGPQDLGIYEYVGRKNWNNHSGSTANQVFYVGAL